MPLHSTPSRPSRASAADATLAPRAVGKIKGLFHIPHFQRGYRWRVDDVNRLLDDITDAGERHPNKSYWLQPIVLKPRTTDDGWDLIDGQQRLTTLFLMFKYLKDHELHSQGPLFTIEYETRPGTKRFLESMDPAAAASNIDFHHLWRAYQTIGRWLNAEDRNPHLAATKLYLHLMERVQVIWYEAPSLSDPDENEQDSIALFTRLNVGRIPLTNAELVKATLLRGARGAARDRSLELAAEWDSIERDLRDDSLWAFASMASPDVYPTRISLLLNGLAPWTGDGSRPRFHTFEELSARVSDGGSEEWPGKEVWGDVVERHDRLRGWYDDRDVYHLVGFLVATGTSIDDLLAEGEDLGRSQLLAALTARIRDRLGCTASSLLELRYDRNRDAARLGDALLLMNTESVRTLADEVARYPFRLHHAGSWSLEHVHAQNAQELTKVDQWTTWLVEHRSALNKLPPGAVDPSPLSSLTSRIDSQLDGLTREVFRRLAAEVAQLFSVPSAGSHSVHGLNNLALLASGHNSRIGNEVFAVKRRMILEMDRSGEFIPPCTRRVFLKYYTDDDSQQLHYWSQADQAAYVDAALELLAPYLAAESTHPERNQP